MKRILLFVFLFLVFLSSNNSTFAGGGAISDGLVYLGNIQSPDGFWSGITTTDFHSTFAVLETLKILDKTADSTYQKGFIWSRSYAVNNVDNLSKKIVLLLHNNIDFSQELTTILSLRDMQCICWGMEKPFSGDPLDTALALQALKVVDYSDQEVIGSALSYLLNIQNPDGGWGFYPSVCSNCEADPSSVYMTAIVLKTLSQYRTW